MAALPSVRKAVWALPIVFVIAALMVLPAGAFAGAQSTAGSSQTSASGSGVHSAAVGSTPWGGNFAAAKGSFPTVPTSTPFSPGHYSPGSPGASPQSTAGLAATSTVTSVLNSISTGRVPSYAAYLPNYNLLAHPASNPGQLISPFYTASPAPMGVGDLGIGSGGPYQYWTPSFDGQFTLNSYNATAGQLYEDTGGYYWNGLPANQASSPYQSGVQLNTVTTNVSIPGSTTAAFWTQNVIDFSGHQLQFIDNVWNFSGPSLNPGTLYSYNGTFVSGQFYYDLGPTMPLAFPVTIALYNNVSNNPSGRSQVTFGYRVTEPGHVFAGVYDTVVFNSIAPPLPADFLVNGNTATPIGAFYDSELVFTGPGAGSNAVINSVNGSLNLMRQVGPTYSGVPAAFDYGGDTGETAVGVASTWFGATENVTTGPSLLYGLWNTLQTGSGSIHFTAHVTPSYGFVFVGPALAQTYNFSWAPTDLSGTVSTYLPPVLFGYNFTVFADGYHQFAGTPFSASTTDTVTMVAAPAVLDAPLYMGSAAQASALAAAVGGSASAPYTFKNLEVRVNLTFNRLNDWGFPTFSLVQASGFSAAVDINNVYVGPNWHGITQWFQSPFGYTGNIPYLGQQYVVYDGTNDAFSNLNLAGVLIPAGVVQGGAISLWNDTGASISNVVSQDDSFGVWAAASPHTTVTNSVSGFGAAVFSVIASADAVGTNFTAEFGSAAVFDEGGSAGTFTTLSASFGSVGFDGFWANATTLSGVSSETGSEAVYAIGGIGLTVTTVHASSSAGVVGYGVTTSSVNGVTATNGSPIAVGFLGGSSASVSNVVANGSTGVVFENFMSGTLTGLTAENSSSGVAVLGSEWVNVSSVNATTGSQAALVSGSSFVSLSGISAAGPASVGSVILASTDVNVTTVTVSGQDVGTIIQGSQNVNVRGTTASDGSVGVFALGSSWVTVDQTTVSGQSLAVGLNQDTDASVNGVTASNSTLSGPWAPGFVFTTFGAPALAAVVTTLDSLTTVSNVTATTYPAAVYDGGSGTALTGSVTFSNVNATGGEFGVLLNGTEYATLSNIGAFHDVVGVEMNENAQSNLVTGSSFVGDSSFGVYIAYGEGNLVYNNNFVGDNGATRTYDPTHVQAWSYVYNSFDLNGVGNYWADWHTYTSYGVLAPYYVSSGVWDYYPIGPDEYQMFTVTFNETGLVAGTSWAVNFDGIAETSSAASIAFSVPMGSYPYAVGPVPGYAASPSTGTVAAGPNAYLVGVTFSRLTYAVTVSEGGLPSGTSWNATVNGVTQSTSGTTLVFYEPNGTFTYALGSVGGFNVKGGNGSVTVAGQPTSISGMYSPSNPAPLATKSDLNNYFALALLVAVIALVVGLIALFLRRGGSKSTPPSSPPEAWTPPAGASSPGSPASGSSGSNTWSEGPDKPPTS